MILYEYDKYGRARDGAGYKERLFDLLYLPTLLYRYLESHHYDLQYSSVRTVLLHLPGARLVLYEMLLLKSGTDVSVRAILLRLDPSCCGEYELRVRSFLGSHYLQYGGGSPSLCAYGTFAFTGSASGTVRDAAF
jgi:hypothetical protein